MRISWAAYLALIAALAASSAEAADVNWRGCYVGVQAGAGRGNSQHIDSIGRNITPEYGIRGNLVGATGGCNFQSGRIVFGVEGDYSSDNTKGGAGDIPPFNASAVSETKEKWLATLRGRLGYSIGDWILFGTAGYAVAKTEIVVSGTGAFSALASEAKNRSGWTAGLGAEWAFAPNWSAKIEYQYIKLKNSGYFNPSPPPQGLATFVNRSGGIPVDENLIRVGLNYRF